jgi:hypothetical protein
MIKISCKIKLKYTNIYIFVYEKKTQLKNSYFLRESIYSIHVLNIKMWCLIETIQHYTWTQIKVKEQHFYCCLTFHSHSSIFNNERNSYPITSVIPSLELSDTHYENTTYGHLCCFVISMLFDVEGEKRDVYILVLFHETSHFNVQYMYWINGYCDCEMLNSNKSVVPLL